jgi:hypothetical protein
MIAHSLINPCVIDLSSFIEHWKSGELKQGFKRHVPHLLTKEKFMKLRKQVYKITLTDLAQFPVWEFALDEEGEDGQDEATVRPYQYSPPLDPNDGMFVVKAIFTLADGTQLEGYLTPPVQGQNDIGTLQPIIITERGQVSFWYGIQEPNSEEINKMYRMLGKNASQVFPLRFKSAVEILDGDIEGILEGFLFFKLHGGDLTNRTVELNK